MRLVLTISIFLFLISCQPDGANNSVPSELSKLEKELEMQPSPERAKTVLKGLNDYVRRNYADFDKIKPQLIRGAELSKEYGFLDQAPGFLLPLIRSKENTTSKLPHLLDMGDVMVNLNKVHASNVIYSQLLKSNPNNKDVLQRKSLIDSVALARSDYMGYLFSQVTINPDDIGINKKSALIFVDAAEAYGLVSPKDSKTPDYLYKAAEIARSMGTMSKAMGIYDWILDDYPNFEKAPTVLFIKGFILEQDFKQTEEAKKIYTQFMERYPNHQMASSVKFLLDNLGKSEADILTGIEKSANK